MQILPIDVVALVAVVMGISLVLVPVLGLTARFALKPTVEALSKFFDARGQEEVVGLVERRLALLEQQMELLEGTVQRIDDRREFDRQLMEPAATESTTVAE